MCLPKISAIIIVIEQINKVIFKQYDFINLIFDRVHDKIQLCHNVAK